MKIAEINTIESLIEQDQWPAVSIYMPVSKIGDPQDPIRYKNILSKVENLLTAEGSMRNTEIRELLRPEHELVKNVEYWKHSGAQGLAVFISPDEILHYSLPVDIQELVQVGRCFHITPLIPLLNDEPYLVLALSKSRVQLFRGDRFSLEETALPEGTPAGMDDALRFDDAERQLQFHTKTPASAGEKRGAIFHGQGVGHDDEDSNLERYFQAVDRSLFPHLDEQRCPVVLAGSDKLLALYRRTSKGRMITETAVVRNISDQTLDDLHAESRKAVAAYFSVDEDEAIQRYRNNLGTGLVTDEIESILKAAFEGRVETLFVVADRQVWGEFDPETLTVASKEDNNGQPVDLLNEAALWTLRRTGNVYLKKIDDMPCEAIICAHLRF